MTHAPLPLAAHASMAASSAILDVELSPLTKEHE